MQRNPTCLLIVCVFFFFFAASVLLRYRSGTIVPVLHFYPFISLGRRVPLFQIREGEREGRGLWKPIEAREERRLTIR